MKSSEIRNIFLDFFKQKEHLILPSFSLIPQDDPTLLLIGAGMAPLKPYFTGEKKPPHTRIATCQKCVRTPDIEKVGYTARHATFFEMLGNFSFGDYFKEEAITWAWELVTKGYKLPPERLYASIYYNDEEAYSIWRDIIGLSESRIYRLGKDDNFWEIGVGPCGPSSEIYYDRGPEFGCGEPSCKIGCDCDRYIELWNLVFTQFFKHENGEYTELEQKNIDTGAGLERLAVVLQDVSTLFEIDIVRPIVDHFATKAGVNYGENPGEDISLRVITEHLRGIVFMVADGILPSNEGRGYVLRRILRRAVRHGTLLEMKPPFLYEAVPIILELMGDAYPELENKKEFIHHIIKNEEERFKETLEQGMNLLEKQVDELTAKGDNILPGKDAFKLYDTFGFPIDLTREILEERGLQLDEEGFQSAMQQQREKARAAMEETQKEKDMMKIYPLVEGLKTDFVGYDYFDVEANVIGIIDPTQRELLSEIEATSNSHNLYLILDRTPFYAEQGGQVGDTGYIRSAKGVARVNDTIHGPGGIILHEVALEHGHFTYGDNVYVFVDDERRKKIARNHTATHLFHRALKNILGEHVNQSGSLVAPDRLRFDFTHFAHLEDEEIKKIEREVNSAVLENFSITAKYTNLQDALEIGATALFDEKYEDIVRIIIIDNYSIELCGGTHVSSTAEIGLCKIISEGGVGSGLRRIEAYTGDKALEYLNYQEEIIAGCSQTLKVKTHDLPDKIHELLDTQKEYQRKIKQLQQELALKEADSLLEKTVYSSGIPVLSAQVEVESMETLREYIDRLKEKMGSGVILLGTSSNGKVLFAAAVTKDLVEKGFHAGRLVEKVAQLAGGGGGGRPDMAQAGGKEPEKLDYALSLVPSFVEEQQKSSC